MNRRTTDLLHRLAEADPDEATATSQFAREPTRQATLDLVLAGDPDPRFTRPARGPRRLWPLALGAAALATAIVAGVSLLPPSHGDKGVGPLAPAPADAFAAAARVAAARPAEEPGPGQAWLLRQRSTRSVGGPSVERSVEDYWFAGDGRVWHRVVEAVIPGMPMRVDHGIDTTSFKELSGVALTTAQLRALPTDQAALRKVLTAAFERSGDRFTPTKDPAAEMALVLLGYPLVRPAQRAALYELLSDSPSARVLGKATDPAGRPAVAVTVDNAAPRPGSNTLVDTFMFDPKTSEVLSWEVKVARTDPRDMVKLRVGQVLHLAVNESWRIVPAPR